MGEEKALGHVTAERGQFVQLFVGLNALGHRRHLQRVGHRDDGGDDLAIAGAASDVLDETAVDLQDVDLEVLKALETARKEKRIGSAQEAAVEVGVPPADFDFLAARRDDLETICIVSRLTVRRYDVPAAGQTIAVRVERAPGVKCPRCWNYRESVGASATHPELCDRCVAVLQETQ